MNRKTVRDKYEKYLVEGSAAIPRNASKQEREEIAQLLDGGLRLKKEDDDKKKEKKKKRKKKKRFGCKSKLNP